MNKIFAKLPRFARPFVTRALRGPRAARFGFLALVLGLLTVLASAWIAFGGGAFEQQVRIGLAIEDNPVTRRLEHFVVSYRDPWVAKRQTRERDELVELATLDKVTPDALQSPDFEVQSAFNAVYSTLDAAAVSRPTGAAATAENEARWQAAARLRVIGPAATIHRTRWSMQGYENAYVDVGDFDWNDEKSLARLDRAIALEGIPRVELYTPPTTALDAMRVLAYLAASVLAFLSLLVLPVMAGTSTAQEVGDGTLSPLRSTALSSRDIVLGLAAGPLAIVALLAVPQIGLYLVGAAIAGNIVAAVLALGVMALLSAVSTLLAQLVGLLVGHQRSPGLIAVPLAALAGVSLLVGTVLSQVAADEERATTLLAACPQANVASWAFLGAGGGPTANSTFIISAAIGAVAMVVFSAIALLALERRVCDRPGPLVRPVEYAAIAAATFVSTVWATTPMLWDGGDRDEAIVMGMLLAVPVMLIAAMGRIPVADPNARANFAMPMALAELSLPWLVVFVVLGMAGVELFGVPALWPWLLWAVVVLQLVAVRSVLAPVGVAGGALLLWTVFTSFVVVGEIGVRADRFPSHLFMFSELSPMLGFLEALSLVAIPVLLVLGVRPTLARRSS